MFPAIYFPNFGETGGTCDYPQEEDVREGIEYAGGAYVGTLTGFVGDLDLPDALEHSPADIARAVLILDGLGTPPSSSLSWPIYATNEPDRPDNVITCFDTGEQLDGRRMIDGKALYHYAIMARIRSGDHTTGYVKSQNIRTYLAEVLRQREITVGSKTYLLHAASKISSVRCLNKEAPHSALRLFTVNFLLSITQRS